MNPLIDAQPIEMTSEVLSGTKFETMVESDFSNEKLEDFVITGISGEESSFKVKLYSLDIERRGEDCSTTISMGNFPAPIVAALISDQFTQASLNTKHYNVMFLKGYVNRVSVSDGEFEGFSSVIVDVRSPRIVVKSNLSE